VKRKAAVAVETREAELAGWAHGRETLLVVEDEPSILKIVGTTLRRLGYTVIEAGSAREALALAARHEGPLHLLLTDVIMPEMNGRDLYAEIVARYPGIKAIFMSGYSEDIFPLLEEGFIPFLQKPFRMRELSDTVRETLDGK